MAKETGRKDENDPGAKCESVPAVESSEESGQDFELAGLPLVFVVIGVALAIFLMSLDSSIIATAIPRIISQFNSPSDIGWYGSAYSFAMCALQPIAGKVFTMFPLKVILPGDFART